MTRAEAETLVAMVRERILELFPDANETYQLIYAPRFRRLIDEFTTASPDRRRSVLPLQS
jgi:hypothetical protein